MEDDDWQIRPGRGLGPLELDLDRESIIERLTASEIPFDAPDDTPTTLELDDGDLCLTMTDDEPHRLIQIVVYNDLVRLNDRPVIDRPLLEVIDASGIADDDMLWRHDPSHNDDPRGAVEQPREPVSDRQLLINGMLWIRSAGIGLQLFRGHVEEVFIRLPEHVPADGSGPLTERQRELLSQDDFDVAITPPTTAGTKLFRVMQLLLTMACAVTIGGIVWQGALFQQRWNQALKAEGTVIAVDPPPPAPFPDEMTVEYTDADGHRHQVVWTVADLYVPKVVGEKVDVPYLPEAPDKPMGPARVRDAAFLVYVPYGIATMAAYLILLSLMNVGWMIVRKLIPAESAVTE